MPFKEIKMANEDINEELNQAADKAGDFYQSNSKVINIVLLAIIIVGGGVFAYTKWYKAPLELEAQEYGWKGVQYGLEDSLNLALDGTEDFEGLLSISDQYGSTAEGSLANFQIGTIYLRQGEFESAIEYFENTSFDNNSIFNYLSLGGIGDAYSELGESDKAISYYEKAGDRANNPLLSGRFWFKAAVVAELEQEDYAKAQKFYQKFLDAFPETKRSVEHNTAEKHARRLATMSE